MIACEDKMHYSERDAAPSKTACFALGRCVNSVDEAGSLREPLPNVSNRAILIIVSLLCFDKCIIRVEIDMGLDKIAESSVGKNINLLRRGSVACKRLKLVLM